MFNLRAEITDPGEVTLKRGTRPSCPLSPLLFALAIKPFAEKIRQDPEVVGVGIAKQQYKLNLFADDLLMYLTNFEKSIPSLFKINRNNGTRET